MVFSSGANTASAGGKTSGSFMDTRTAVVYSAFGFCAFLVHHYVAEWELSAILTMSVMAQCLSFALLGLQISAKRSMRGVSMQTLLLDVMSLCCRLSSTMVKQGYLPVDATGDYVYQAADICSLLLVLYLLHLGWGEFSRTYQAEADDFSVAKLAIGALLLACICHADMNHSWAFDVLWTTSVYIDAVAAMPQLWMIAKSGGAVEALTSHHIATLIVSRLFAGAFWFIARNDLAFTPYIEGWNHAAWGILGAYAVHLIVGADFAYYYIKAVLTQGLANMGTLVCEEV